jgi:hypothetical protein
VVCKLLIRGLPPPGRHTPLPPETKLFCGTNFFLHLLIYLYMHCAVLFQLTVEYHLILKQTICFCRFEKKNARKGNVPMNINNNDLRRKDNTSSSLEITKGAKQKI